MATSTSQNSKCPDDLLPWFVNRTLAPQLYRMVEDHLQHCRRCKQEVTWLRQVRTGIQSSSAPTPGELGLKRLLQRVHDGKTDMPARQSRQRRWLRPALAIAASLVIVIQAGLLIHSWFGPAAITPLSSPQAEGIILQVTFVPTATETQIRAVMRSVGGNFVGGPGALGVYRIRLNPPIQESYDVQRILNTLRQQDSIISHVARE